MASLQSVRTNITLWRGLLLKKACAPATVFEKITPPGLLAARRIAYELSMRSKRDMQKSKQTVFLRLCKPKKSGESWYTHAICTV
jgi:hypothetical protein